MAEDSKCSKHNSIERKNMPVTKPKKQRRMLFQAPDHIRYKHFAAPLSPELKASHGAKAVPVRSGDTVHIMRGDYKGFEGKITRVDRKKYRIYVEGLKREKADGTTIFVPIHPSKVMITDLNLEDKWRRQILERKREARKIEEVPAKPAPEEVVEKKEAVEEKIQKKKPKKRKKKAPKKPPEKKVEEKPKKPKKRKKAKKKKTKRTKKEEKPKKKTRGRRKTTKKTEGGK